MLKHATLNIEYDYWIYLRNLSFVHMSFIYYEEKFNRTYAQLIYYAFTHTHTHMVGIVLLELEVGYP